MLRRIAAIIRREYLERVKTKAFWISTLLVPIFLGGIMLVPMWLASRGGGEYRIAVLDLAGQGDALRAALAERTGGEESALDIQLEMVARGPDLAATREELKARVQEGEFEGLLILPPDLTAEGRPEYVAPNVAALRLLSVLERAVNDVVVNERLTGAGLAPEQVRNLTRRVDLSTMKLGKRGEETEDRGQAFFLSYILMFVIYMTVLMYGIYVMRGVLEEKQSRIVEVVISTVRPFELMLGKLLGIGSVGLTQYLVWALAAAVLASPAAAGMVGMSGMDMPTLPASVLVFFVVFFVLGFFLYGTLYAAVGAAFDTEQEAQNFQGVITTFLIVPIMLMFYIINQPDSTVSVVLSLIPFFTPMLMFLRMTLVSVPPLQVALSIVLMIGAILVSSWVAARIYRVGILMHGSKPKLTDLAMWLRG